MMNVASEKAIVAGRNCILASHTPVSGYFIPISTNVHVMTANMTTAVAIRQ